MTNSEAPINWSNLPKSLINAIYANLTPLDLLESRLINKHWSNISNPWVFAEIDVFSNKEEIIKNYSKCISKLSNYHLNEDLISLIADNCKNLKSITWVLPSDMSALLKILNNSTDITYISLMYSELDEEVDKVKLDLILSTILNLKSLQQIDLEVYEDILLNLFLNLPNNLIEIVELYSYPDAKSRIISKLRSLKKLKKVNWNMLYPLQITEEPNRSEVLNPSNLTEQMNLDHVAVRLSRYKDSQGSMENYLVDTLSNLFNSPNFNSLKSLEWRIPSLNINYSNLFPHDIPFPPRVQKFTNLRLINLMTMDKYLLSYIIEMCPMLEDLRFISPLILPHKVHKLSSLNRLKKLLCVGFEEDIEDSSDQIRRIFPNVHVVNMHYTTDRLPKSIMQASPIPKLFPKASSVIFGSHEYNSIRLIDNINSGDVSCEWKTLYIVLHSYNKELLDPLLGALNNLEQLFIFAYNEYDYPEVINHPVSAYKAGHLDFSAYTFNIIEKF